MKKSFTLAIIITLLVRLSMRGQIFNLDNRRPFVGRDSLPDNKHRAQKSVHWIPDQARNDWRDRGNLIFLKLADNMDYQIV